MSKSWLSSYYANQSKLNNPSNSDIGSSHYDSIYGSGLSSASHLKYTQRTPDLSDFVSYNDNSPYSLPSSKLARTKSSLSSASYLSKPSTKLNYSNSTRLSAVRSPLSSTPTGSTTSTPTTTTTSTTSNTNTATNTSSNTPASSASTIPSSLGVSRSARSTLTRSNTLSPKTLSKNRSNYLPDRTSKYNSLLSNNSTYQNVSNLNNSNNNNIINNSISNNPNTITEYSNLLNNAFQSLVHYGDSIGAKSVKCLINESLYETQSLINQGYDIYQVIYLIRFILWRKNKLKIFCSKFL